MEDATNYRIEIIGEGPLDPVDDNVDVCVFTEAGRYDATFFTLKNVETLLDRWKDSRDPSGGLYFWAVDAIIVRELSDETIHQVVRRMLDNGELGQAFGGPYEHVTAEESTDNGNGQQ